MLKTATLATMAAGLAQAAHYTPEAAKIWENAGPAAMTDRKTFTVAMPMRDWPALERTLLDISDPLSPNYGKWLSQKEADALTATSADIAEEVREWATSTGAECYRQPEAWRCEGTVQEIEMLLNAKLDYWQHKTEGHKIIRTSMQAPGEVPSSLEGKVIMVTGLTQFPMGHRAGHVRSLAEVHSTSLRGKILGGKNGKKVGATDYAVVPETLRILYNATDVGAAASNAGAIEFQGYPSPPQTDLDGFSKDMGLPNIAISKAHTIGPLQPSPAAESELDVQYLFSMAPSATQWYWTEADWQYEFGQHINSQPAGQFPNVMSISYAWYELDQCDISPSVAPCTGKPVPAGSVAFVEACNQLYAKAGARGITLISASGDSGAHGRTDPGCTDPKTRPDFPACSPYITSVGATELANGKTGTTKTPICQSQLQCAIGGTEVVASNKLLALFSSGGGFSTVAPRPTWQDAAVKAYLAQKGVTPPAADFNASNRAFPDVAALGHNYAVVIGGTINMVDGTSAATPVFAGLMADINAWRIANNKPVLGFVSPLLYQIYAANPKSYNDITSGDNSCTESACPCPANTGYYAAPGFDATTGLGTLNYGIFKETMAAMGI